MNVLGGDGRERQRADCTTDGNHTVQVWSMSNTAILRCAHPLSKHITVMDFGFPSGSGVAVALKVLASHCRRRHRRSQDGMFSQLVMHMKAAAVLWWQTIWADYSRSVLATNQNVTLYCNKWWAGWLIATRLWVVSVHFCQYLGLPGRKLITMWCITLYTGM